MKFVGDWVAWDLHVAEAREEYLHEGDCWRYTQQFLLHAHHTTTYKYILMKALLECMAEISDSGRLSFLEVSKHVTKIYWNLSVKHQLSQMNAQKKSAGVDKVIRDFQQTHHIPSDWNFDRMEQENQHELIKKVNALFKKYVYGSFYSAFNGTIYSFNKKEEWLQLTPPYIVFFEKFKRIIMNLTNYQLALFLEKYNSADKVEHLLQKVEFVSVRQSLKEFQLLLHKYGELDCFYCKKAMRKTQVDHFIPWHYMQNDVLWNFVLACPSCNASKNSKLAHSDFLEILVDRNNRWRSYEEMGTYSEKKLVHMHDYALLNGYLGDWVPRGS